MQKKNLRIFFAVMVILLSPLLIEWSGIVNPSLMYRDVLRGAGPFRYFEEEIFQKKNDIDILVIGSSVVWQGINVEVLKQRLSHALNREASVVMLGSNWRGDDLYFVLLRDMLRQRKVKMVILQMPLMGQDMRLPQLHAFRWMSYDVYKELFDKADWNLKFTFFGSFVLAAPRKLIAYLRGNYTDFNEQKYELLDGFLPVKSNIDGSAFEPKFFNSSDIAKVQFRTSENDFIITKEDVAPYLRLIMNETGQLLKKYDVPTIFVHIPSFNAFQNTKMTERQNWPKYFGVRGRMIGVSESKLFSKYTTKDFKNFFSDASHLNLNGANLFTGAISEEVVEEYLAEVH